MIGSSIIMYQQICPFLQSKNNIFATMEGSNFLKRLRSDRSMRDWTSDFNDWWIWFDMEVHYGIRDDRVMLWRKESKWWYGNNAIQSGTSVDVWATHLPLYNNAFTIQLSKFLWSHQAISWNLCCNIAWLQRWQIQFGELELIMTKRYSFHCLSIWVYSS